MKKEFLVLALIGLFAVSGCVDKAEEGLNQAKDFMSDFGGITRGPESTAEDFVDNVLSGNLESAANMMVTRDLEPYQEARSDSVSVYQALGENFDFEIKGVKTSAVSKKFLSDSFLESLELEEGYRVQVSLTLERSGNEFTTRVPVEVVKVDGDWKVLAD